MATKWLVNGDVVAEAPSIFDNPDLDKEISNSIRGIDRIVPKKTSSRDRRKMKANGNQQ